MTRETYLQMTTRHRSELDALPIQWAFGKEQAEEALKALGVEPGKGSDIELVRIPGGGICTKETAQQLSDMLNRHSAEHKALMDADTTGEGFIFDMFDYELANHEYCVTHDVEPTLFALDITLEEVEKSPALQHGLKLAIKENREEL